MARCMYHIEHNVYTYIYLYKCTYCCMICEKSQNEPFDKSKVKARQWYHGFFFFRHKLFWYNISNERNIISLITVLNSIQEKDYEDLIVLYT